MSTKISWTDETWNPVHGCSHAKSPGCDHCYARRMSKRLAGRCGYPPAPDNFKVTLRPDRLEQPLRWRKPRQVFVCSMSDLFHDDVPDEFIQKVFAVMALAYQHTFQVLTKRPARMQALIESNAFRIEVESIAIINRLREDLQLSERNFDTFRRRIKWPLDNVWLGITAENQTMLDERWQYLRYTEAALHYISFEPLLGSVILPKDFTGRYAWAITGGETGPGARPMHPVWARGLRDQCQAAEVAFHFKQWGEWLHFERRGTPGHGYYQAASGERLAITDFIDKPHEIRGDFGVARIGNKRAGHMLDGKEWREMPEVTK